MSEEQEIHGVSQTGSKHGKNSESKAMICSPDCGYCGLRHSRGRSKCLAFGKTCMSCGKKNHFAHVCQRSGSSCARSDTENIRRANDRHEDSYDESDDEQQMMTVTLTLDVEAVNSVSSSTSRFEHQVM